MKDISIFLPIFSPLIKTLPPNSQTKSYVLFASFERKGVENFEKKIKNRGLREGRALGVIFLRKTKSFSFGGTQKFY